MASDLCDDSERAVNGIYSVDQLAMASDEPVGGSKIGSCENGHQRSGERYYCVLARLLILDA